MSKDNHHPKFIRYKKGSKFPEPCAKHKNKLPSGYVAAHEEAERRIKKGQKQKQCPACLHWYFNDEM